MKFIGISGVAKAGKDTFFKGLIDAYPELKFTRISVADIIREDVSDFLFRYVKIHSWECTSIQKEQIRPLLAWYGDIQRKRTQGRYFLDQIDTVLQDNKLDCDYAVLTDLRFKEFAFDEPDWIHAKGGKVIHLKRILPDGSNAQPANDLEKLNDPKIYELADTRVTWNTFLPLPTKDFLTLVATEVRKLELI